MAYGVWHNTWLNMLAIIATDEWCKETILLPLLLLLHLLLFFFFFFVSFLISLIHCNWIPTRLSEEQKQNEYRTRSSNGNTWNHCNLNLLRNEKKKTHLFSFIIVISFILRMAMWVYKTWKSSVTIFVHSRAQVPCVCFVQIFWVMT